LQTFKAEIKLLLIEEIASRFYYQKGRIRAALISDKQVEKALEICKNTDLYSSILENSSTVN